MLVVLHEVWDWNSGVRACSCYLRISGTFPAALPDREGSVPCFLSSAQSWVMRRARGRVIRFNVLLGEAVYPSGESNVLRPGHLSSSSSLLGWEVGEAFRKALYLFVCVHACVCLVSSYTKMREWNLFPNGFSFHCPNTFGISCKYIWYFSQNFQTVFILWFFAVQACAIWNMVCGPAASVCPGAF